MERSTDSTNLEDNSKSSPLDNLDKEVLVKKCKALLVIAQKAKNSRAEVQDDLTKIKTQLEKCENEKKASESNEKTLQELVDSLTEQKLNYIIELDKAENKVKNLTVKCNSIEEQLVKLKDESRQKDEKLSEIMSQNSNIDSEVKSYKRQNKQLSDENDQLINQLTELENKIEEFNQLGLIQRQQLEILEEKVNAGNSNHIEEHIEELKNKIIKLQEEIEALNVTNKSCSDRINDLVSNLETETQNKDKAYSKLKSYKEKILKCVTCINQLKDTKHILLKTVKEYHQNITKWQSEILKASHLLDKQLTEINNENSELKLKMSLLQKKIDDFVVPSNNDTVDALEKQIQDCNSLNSELSKQIQELNAKFEDVNENEVPTLMNENNALKNKVDEFLIEIDQLKSINNELKNELVSAKSDYETLKNAHDSTTISELQLRVRSLESEKEILFKEKLDAKENLLDAENQNKLLNDQLKVLRSDIQELNVEYINLKKSNNNLSQQLENANQTNLANNEMLVLKESYDVLKNEYDNILDLNGLLKEEVETLRSSLDQPRDDSELSEALQADIAKLETKLSAYKQENNSLLAEIKEYRSRVKDAESKLSDHEEVKSKLHNYKSENAELLNEMKEINEVLKERGELISKLQKAVSESASLIETLEKNCADSNLENEKLKKKEYDLKHVEEIKTPENEERFASEKNQLLQVIKAKDANITLLKDEIKKLKHQASSADLPNEDMSSSTISKAEDHARMRDLDETFEDKYTKLRVFALKLKKKLNETTSQLQVLQLEKSDLEKTLKETADNKPGNEMVEELDSKVKALTASLEGAEKVEDELVKLKDELNIKTKQLLSESQAHAVTKEELERTKRDVKKKSVLSLEMDDYEKSMKELTAKLDANKDKMVQMESTIDTHEGTIKAMKTQIKLLEEQIKTEERQNRLTKEELQRAIDNSKEKDQIVTARNELIHNLEHQLEIEKRKNEDSNIEMTGLLGEKEKLIMSLGEEKVELINKLKKVEFNCADLKEKLSITNIELEDLKTEHSSYKVRAQAVLRQNQTVDHSVEEQLKEETAAVKSQLVLLTDQLKIAQEQCNELRALSESERRRAAEAMSETSRATQRNSRLQTDLARVTSQMDSDRSTHKLQVATLTQLYKSQLSEMESSHQKEINKLKNQIVLLEEKVKNESDKVNSNKSPYIVPIREESSDTEMDINVSLMPREEGEGSEFAPSPPLSKSFLTAGGNRSPVPLERLLEDGVPDDINLDGSALGMAPEQEIHELKKKLIAQQDRVKHVTVLLHELEGDRARFAQLNEVLKAEVRRARDSLERTTHAHNAEYMKNVTMKFLTLPPGDERSRLVPVLQKILTLTSDETHKLNAVAKGNDPTQTKGWGTYLPWPGGK